MKGSVREKEGKQGQEKGRIEKGKKDEGKERNDVFLLLMFLQAG